VINKDLWSSAGMKRINIAFNTGAFGAVSDWMSASTSAEADANGLSTVAANASAVAVTKATAFVDEPNLMRPARLGLGAAYLPHSQAMAAADEKMKRDVERSRRRAQERAAARKLENTEHAMRLGSDGGEDGDSDGGGGRTSSASRKRAQPGTALLSKKTKNKVMQQQQQQQQQQQPQQGMSLSKMARKRAKKAKSAQEMAQPLAVALAAAPASTAPSSPPVAASVAAIAPAVPNTAAAVSASAAITDDIGRPGYASQQARATAAAEKQARRKKTKTRSKQKNRKRDNRPSNQQPSVVRLPE